MLEARGPILEARRPIFVIFWIVVILGGAPAAKNYSLLGTMLGPSWSQVGTKIDQKSMPIAKSDFLKNRALAAAGARFLRFWGSKFGIKIKQKSMENPTQNSPTNACEMVAPRAKNQAQIPAKICKILQKTCAPSQIPIRRAILLRVRRSRASVLNPPALWARAC